MSEVAHFSDMSSAACSALPSTQIASSVDAGWSSLLVERHSASAGFGEFVTLPTPDVHLVVGLKGSHRLEVYKHGHWSGDIYQEASLGLTAGGEIDRLRYATTHGYEVGHVFLPHCLVAEAAETLRRAGQRASHRALSALRFEDRLLAASVHALLAAFEKGLPELYAEQAAVWLATHTLAFHGGVDADEPLIDGAALSDARLSRAIDLIKQQYSEPLTLEMIASAAGISKFHFTRLFRRRTGCTPAAYLEETRMRVSRRMLVAGDLSIAEIARRTGYRSADQFGVAFRRRYGMAPTSFRRTRENE